MEREHDNNKSLFAPPSLCLSVSPSLCPSVPPPLRTRIRLVKLFRLRKSLRL